MKQNVPHSPYDFSDYYPCREMTAADLGLPEINYCAKHNNLHDAGCYYCGHRPGERLVNWGDIVMDGKP